MFGMPNSLHGLCSRFYSATPAERSLQKYYNLEEGTKDLENLTFFYLLTSASPFLCL